MTEERLKQIRRKSDLDKLVAGFHLVQIAPAENEPIVYSYEKRLNGKITFVKRKSPYSIETIQINRLSLSFHKDGVLRPSNYESFIINPISPSYQTKEKILRRTGL